MSMVWKRLQSPVLGQRLAGMAELEESIRDVNLRAISNNAHSSNRGLSKVWLRDWILDQRVVEDLFGDRLDVRCVVRAGPVLAFLAEQRGICGAHFETIWRACCGGCHESTRIGIYDVIVEHLLPALQPDQRLELFSRYVSQTPYDAYTEMFLHFLKKFTIKALHADEEICKIVGAADNAMSRRVGHNGEAAVAAAIEKGDDEEKEPPLVQEARHQLKVIRAHPKTNSYGINLMWEFLQDAPTTLRRRGRAHARESDVATPRKESRGAGAENFVNRPVTASRLGRTGGQDIVPPPANMDFDTAQEAIVVLTDLLGLEVCEKRNYKKRIVQKCVSCLQDGTSVPQALQVLTKVLEIYPVQTSGRAKSLPIPDLSVAKTGQARAYSNSPQAKSSSSRSSSISGAATAISSSSRRWFRRKSSAKKLPSRAAPDAGLSPPSTAPVSASSSSQNSFVEISAGWADQSRADIIDSFLMNRQGKHPNLLEMFFDELRVYCSRVAMAMRESGLRARTASRSQIRNLEAAALAAKTVIFESATLPGGLPVHLSSPSGRSTSTSSAIQGLSVGHTGRSCVATDTNMGSGDAEERTAISEAYVDEFRLPSSCYSHRSQIKARLDFLMFALKNSASIKLQPEHALALWECLVTQAVSNGSQDIAFEWFCGILDPWFANYGSGRGFVPVADVTRSSEDEENEKNGEGGSRKGVAGSTKRPQNTKAKRHARDSMRGKLRGKNKRDSGAFGSGSKASHHNCRNFAGVSKLLMAGFALQSREQSGPGSTKPALIDPVVLSDSTIANVLVNPSMVPSLRLRTLSHHGWKLFLRYFLVVNATTAHSLALHPTDDTCIIRSGFTLLGIDELWSIALGTTDPQVGNSAIKLLRATHTSLSPQLIAIKSRSVLPDELRAVTQKITQGLSGGGNQSPGGHPGDTPPGKNAAVRSSNWHHEPPKDVGQHVRIHFVLNCLKHVVSAFNHASSNGASDDISHDAGGHAADLVLNNTGTRTSTANPVEYPGARSPLVTASLHEPLVPALDQPVSSLRKEKSWRCVERGMSLLSRFLTDLKHVRSRRRAVASSPEEKAHSHETLADHSRWLASIWARYLQPKEDMSLAYLSLRKREQLRSRAIKSSTSSFATSNASNARDLSYLSGVAQLYFDDLFRIFDSASEIEANAFHPAIVAQRHGYSTFTDDVWNVLQILPVHSGLAKEMRKLKLIRWGGEVVRLSAKEEDVANLDLDFFGILLSPGVSMCRLLYSLQIIDGYLTQRPRSSDPQIVHSNYPKWCQNLIQVDAPRHLCRVLGELAKDCSSGSEAQQSFANGSYNQRLLCLSILFQVIHNFLTLDPKFRADDGHFNPEDDGAGAGMSGAGLSPGLLLAMVDLNVIVEHTMRILLDILPKLASRTENDPKIGLCIDCGMRLLVAAALTANPDGATESETTGKAILCNNMMLLEEFLEASLLRCPERRLRRIVGSAFERLCRKDAGRGRGAVNLAGLVGVLLGRRFFDKVILERRRWFDLDGNNNSAARNQRREDSTGKIRRTRFIQNSEEYWDTLCAVLQFVPASSVTSSVLVRIADRILDQPCGETFVVGSHIDDVFVGLCKACHVALMSADKSMYQNMDNSQSFTQTLRHQLVVHLWSVCLFPAGNVANKLGTSAKGFCTSGQARQAAYRLVCGLLKFSNEADAKPDLLFRFGKLLLHQSNSWSALASRSWSYNVRSNTVSNNNGFVGLRNQGATCYMNSLLQQLFHIPTFRSGLLRITSGVGVVEEPSSSENTTIGGCNSTSNAAWTLFQLQVLFGNLSVSQKSSFDTRPLCDVLREPDGRPLRLTEQKDVNEFCGVLFDLLEQAHPHAKRLLSTHFYGNFVHEIVSKDPAAPYTSTRLEPYFMITVPVKNKDTLEEGLEQLTQSEILTGDNQYRVPSEAGFGDDKKVDAAKSMRIQTLPPYLILHLKRFEFDYETMRKMKVNDSFSFPHRLNMYPYTFRAAEAERRAEEEQRNNTREIRRRRVRKKDKARPGSNQQASEINVKLVTSEMTMPPPAPGVAGATNMPPLPPAAGVIGAAGASASADIDDDVDADADLRATEDSKVDGNASYEYELRGVVAHSGTVDSGHYYSFIGAPHRNASSTWTEDGEMMAMGKPFRPLGTVPPIGSTPSRLSSTFRGLGRPKGAVAGSKSSETILPPSSPTAVNGGMHGTASSMSANVGNIGRSDGAKKRWYEFNDRYVRTFSLERMASECFGGTYVTREPIAPPSEDEGEEMDHFGTPNYSDGAGRTTFKETTHIKNKSAYLLVYERVPVAKNVLSGKPMASSASKTMSGATRGSSVPVVGGNTREHASEGDINVDDTSEDSSELLVQAGSGDLFPSNVFSAVWEKNLRFLQQQQLYDRTMGCRTFVWNIGNVALNTLSKAAAAHAHSAAQAVLLQVFPAVCRYFVVVILRNGFENDGIADDGERKIVLWRWVQLLRKFLHHTLDKCACARWFLDECLGGRGSGSDTKAKLSFESQGDSFTPFASCWLKKILIDCPIPKVRQAFMSLVVDAARVLSTEGGSAASTRLPETYLAKTVVEAPASQTASDDYLKDVYVPRLGEHYCSDGSRIGLDGREGLACSSGGGQNECEIPGLTFPSVAGDEEKTEEESLREALAAVAAAEAAEAAMAAKAMALPASIGGGGGTVGDEEKAQVEVIPFSPVARLIDALAVLVTFADRTVSDAASVASSMALLSSSSPVSSSSASTLSDANLRMWDHAELFRCLRDVLALGDRHDNDNNNNQINAERRYFLCGRGLVCGALLALTTYLQKAGAVHCAWTDLLLLERKKRRVKAEKWAARLEMMKERGLAVGGDYDDDEDGQQSITALLSTYLVETTTGSGDDGGAAFDVSDDEDFFFKQRAEESQGQSLDNEHMLRPAAEEGGGKREGNHYQEGFLVNTARLNRRRLSLHGISSPARNHPLRFASAAILPLLGVLNIARDHGAPEMPGANDGDVVMFGSQKTSASMSNYFVSLHAGEPSETLPFLCGKHFMKSLICTTPEPAEVFRALRHLMWGHLENSLTMAKRLIALTLEQTSVFMHPNAIKCLQCVQLVCRMEGDGEFLMQTRVEAALPPLMGRLFRIIQRREERDDAFTHVASMFVLWCLAHRPHARQLLFLTDIDHESYIDEDWVQWVKLFKIRKKQDDKERKKKKKKKKKKGGGGGFLGDLLMG